MTRKTRPEPFYIPHSIFNILPKEFRTAQDWNSLPQFQINLTLSRLISLIIVVMYLIIE